MWGMCMQDGGGRFDVVKVGDTTKCGFVGSDRAIVCPSS